MVKNLNSLTFADFGSIRPERPAEDRLPRGNDWESETLQTGEVQNQMFYPGAPVYLDYEGGMTVLAASKDGGPFQFFYLDKPVCIQPGVRFALVPYAGNSEVRMVASLGGWPKILPLPDSFTGLQLSRKLEVGRIFTFFYQEKELGFFFPGESHPTWELTYVDKGYIHSVAGGQDLLLEQGDLTLYGPDQWHMQYTDTDCAANYITISFELATGDLNPLLNRKFAAPHQAVELLRQMLRERDRQDEYADDIIICLLGNLLLTLLREGRTVQGTASLRTAAAIQNENDVINRAQRFISENVREKLSVPMVAKEAGVSPSYLTALFHKNLQISPGEYIRRIKLQESRQMIREGKLNFTEISQLLQYSTVHHFSRQFKEKFGITPTQYAKSIR